MSTASHQSKAHRRLTDVQDQNGPFSRDGSRLRKRLVTHNEGYMYALRVAYLAHLLQPQAKRLQHVSTPALTIQRASSSINDLMKDFSLLRDSKSTRFPHGFMAELEKRLTGVIMGKERRAEYQDAMVKRTFAAFFNAFTEAGFRKRMEKDRRVEDLVLIFFSNATKELQKGKAPTDDGWKLMVDRHLAIFVRLISLVLKDHDWTRDRPELTSRLTTLESKLLANDRDLAAQVGGRNSSTVEVLVPRSTEVKDMPLVLLVARIFGLTATQVQSDLDKNKSDWTAAAGLQDLKTYQTLLNLNSRKTLRSDDFDLEEAYDAWKKAEGPDLSQMILAIIQSNPELAKSTARKSLPRLNSQANGANGVDSGYSELARKMSEASDGVSSYAIDTPVDMTSITTSPQNEPDTDEPTFTFIPPEPRSFYRFILSQALSFDLKDDSLQASEPTAETPALKLLSKQSTELLNETCLRWRIPRISRVVLFLDVIREKYLDDEITLDTLDSAFTFIKEPLQETSQASSTTSSALLERDKWPLSDIVLNQQILATLNEALLRDLYNTATKCYETKPPSVGPILFVLDHHIYANTSFDETAEEFAAFGRNLRQGLKDKAYNLYKEYLEKTLPNEVTHWEFFHVIQLGKAVTTICEKIQKRYRKNPEIKGVSPLTALIETMLPLFAEDAKAIISRILQLSEQKDEEVPIDDGFDLYGELVEIRRIHGEALPKVPFAIEVEELLADFVWRWIKLTESNMPKWVDNAVKQDEFKVRTQGPPGQIPAEDERHSVSSIDVFTSFKQTIDRIVQLNWDNDLQYAKFMTALSKIVGDGVARYCEIVEQRFAKEMDRLTPEQEVTATQTRQEKWMQLAKDAWNNKEKIEPFQFFPESFVKLNNVEYAIRQLDKLEREVNVDACAEVIERHAPPAKQRERKATKYVFTIKIVEAEDLKACDINGLSDPYVVLGDEYQKRLAKTRIIYSNLNPRWDETVDITTTGPLNLIATVWDYDTMGEHDCVGRTSIKLDPSHFGDFLPREYWLDLDTQGRLLLRVSMEGERDDIQFYFGKAFRNLKRTERDMTRKITDKLSAYINHSLSRRALKNLLSKGISISSVSNYFNRNRQTQSVSAGPTQVEITDALQSLFTYFDDNFAIMNQTLTQPAMIMVMTRLWKEVLVTIESLMVPPLSEKPSQQKPLSQQELDIVFKWLQLLYDFFHAVDEETKEANGVPQDILRSPKYFELKTLNFFYFDSTDNLIRTSERMASATVARRTAQQNRLSAPASLQFGGAAGLLGMPSTRRSKSIMLSRNLGTMKKAKEDKRKEAQADPNDDMILRILRMRPEAARYLRDRSRQKERLAAAAAAELIVRQSIMAGGGRMMGNLPRR